MKELEIKSIIHEMQLDELCEEEKALILKAREVTYRSYAPYSQFKVGAALLLDNGEIVIGCNNENAVYPLGLCAERTAIFSAQAQFPNVPMCILAISARNSEDCFVSTPITPCGSCRQVILEQEQRYGRNIVILLDSKNAIMRISSAKDLLPLSFSQDSLTS